ncbi:UDP-N-acetylmuramate dehydrogenase [Alteromonas oceanisediminis]|uniref:UDP-N-acetylmuramate dehydrogenase n=1 Tax=Alteromonas oceanisediminis TaxID=2836180 RepID=UPI001BD95A6A|nr:UDP-N-acetylmuramate dehydrogenase [Alteromonas oceanisediminis]MBT0587788.1 UDP-N-acetylmuramate dehydrogenase [Alteromonas oceanisediminis]
MKDLSSLHTFGIAAHCERIIDIQHEHDLVQLQGVSPLLILGGGSNCVFVDDFEGAVVRNQLRGVERTESASEVMLSVASGENWHEFVTDCMEQGIFGFENLALIPGTVGAAPIQNIGAYGRELASFVHTVHAYDLSTQKHVVFNNHECQFGYRESVFKHQPCRWFITRVVFSVPKMLDLETSYGELAALTDPTPHSIYTEVCRVRRAKLPDPDVLGNAGSFFKNPVITQAEWLALAAQHSAALHYRVDAHHVKVPAAWLIDQCGFKGQARGGVRSHTTQPLVLTNIGGASGCDVLAFAREIRDTVLARFNIGLENEVRLIGRKGLVTL